MQNGTNLLVSFPDFEAEAKWEEYEKNRPAEVEAIRERLKQELTPQEAAEKMEALGYGSAGYTGEYDDYYYLAAYEYDAAHSADRLSEEEIERQALEKNLREELTPEEAVEQFRSLWGDELVDETFADRMDEVTTAAYITLSERAYEQAHMDEMVCVSLPDGGSLPHRTFGQGDVYVNSLCVRIRSSRYAEPGGDIQTLIFHMTDGTDFVVVDSLTDNTLFKRVIEHGDFLDMFNSAINIDKIQSVEVVGKLSGATLEADAD
jgi:predicted transcriptional regulator YdeE